MNLLLRILFLITLAAFALPAQADEESLPSIVILADGNLALPLSQVARQFARDKQYAIALSLTDKVEISEQIAEGGTSDVLITARTSWLEQLKQQGLLDVYSETPVARDRLSLIAPANSRLEVSLKDHFPAGKILLQMKDDRIFVVANPQYLPEGAPEREAMRYMGADFDMEPYTIYVDDRTKLHDLIENQHAYGLMLASEARRYAFNVLDDVPDTAHSPISYRAVVLAGERMNHARRFVDYLKSRTARSIFEQHGYELN